MRVFEAFSPIPMLQKHSINENSICERKKLGENGNQQQNNVHKNLDSISNVSMSDISTWFGNGTV